jgi:cysteine-rich repeat protein
MTSRITCMVGFIGFVAVACTYQLPTADPSLVCGDGVEDPEEECDDGNKEDEDGCDSNCTVTACGNGIVTYGEECDDGNDSNEDDCINACKKAKCGDTFVQPIEKCDDGNEVDGDGCETICIPSGCGNGVIAPNEVCDDSNTLNGDKCNPTCTLNIETSPFLGGHLMPGNDDGQGIESRLSDQPIMTIHGTTMYITGDNVVRYVNLVTGNVETIAGTYKTPGYVDNSDGAAAMFGDIEGIASDGITLWVADRDNHILRAVNLLDPMYGVTTVAGMYADVNSMVTAVDGTGPGALFSEIRGMVFYNGLVYLLDSGAYTLRTFNPMNKEVKTIAGSPHKMGRDDGIGAAARFMGPRHIASDGLGMLYITDNEGNTIRSFNTSNNEVKTIAGSMDCGQQDGFGQGARLYRPRGLATDGSSVYFTEPSSDTIRQLILETGEVSTLSGKAPKCAVDCSCAIGGMVGTYKEGTGVDARWDSPWGIAFDPSTKLLYVSDAGNALIRRIQ